MIIGVLGGNITMMKLIFFEWYEGYKKPKAQKASIKKELMSIALHPSRWWDSCVLEDEKRGTEKILTT